MDQAFAKEGAMSTNPIARRLRASSEFTCSRCGGHEAYSRQGQSAFERYVLNAVMVRPVRCCDCDALCYAFPMRLDGPTLRTTERTALVREPRGTETRAHAVYGGTAAHLFRHRPRRTTEMIPTASY